MTITVIKAIVCFERLIFRIIGLGVGDGDGSKTTVVFELIGGLMITAGSIVELETGTIVELEIIGCGLLLVSGRIMIGDVMSNVVGSTGGLRYLPMHA